MSRCEGVVVPVAVELGVGQLQLVAAAHPPGRIQPEGVDLLVDAEVLLEVDVPGALRAVVAEHGVGADPEVAGVDLEAVGQAVPGAGRGLGERGRNQQAGGQDAAEDSSHESYLHHRNIASYTSLVLRDEERNGVARVAHEAWHHPPHRAHRLALVAREGMVGVLRQRVSGGCSRHPGLGQSGLDRRPAPARSVIGMRRAGKTTFLRQLQAEASCGGCSTRKDAGRRHAAGLRVAADGARADLIAPTASDHCLPRPLRRARAEAAQSGAEAARKAAAAN